MRVREGMSEVVLSVGPGHTLREAARLMAKRRVGAAVVVDPDSPGLGIITERDLLDSSLEEAAVAMVRGGFRHLVVCEGADVAGVLSVRDIVRVWTADGSICEVPPAVKLGASA